MVVIYFLGVMGSKLCTTEDGLFSKTLENSFIDHSCCSSLTPISRMLLSQRLKDVFGEKLQSSCVCVPPTLPVTPPITKWEKIDFTKSG